MTILSMRTVHGPNVFHPQPVIMMKLDLKEWTELGSHQIPGLIEKLLKLLPGLQEHTCSPGYPGGFIERLQRGTYPAHIIEHLALELSNRAGSPVSFGKTKYAGKEGVYDVVVRFQNEEGMKLCLKTAVELFTSLVENTPFDLQPKIEAIKGIIAETKLGPSGQALWDAAVKRGIPVKRLGSASLLQLGYGKYRRRVQAAVSDRTGLIASDLVQDKQFTKNLLEDASIPVPHGFVVHTEEELLKVTESFSGPYAIKPFDGHHGNGVALNLKTREDLFKAFYVAKEYSSAVLVEEMCPGRDYRVLVIGGRFTAAAERKPPQVVGDGSSTIQQLIDQLNLDPRRGEGHMNTLTRIEIDSILIETLKKQNMTLESVPENDRSVILRANANLSSGGTSKDVTETVHPEVRALCERISRVVDLDICGVDVIAQDLALPPESSGLKIIEVNAGPGLRMHLAPTEGEVRKVGEDIIQMLYPTGAPSRIPIVAVTGTNGKTTTVRLLHKILSVDATVGLTTSDGVYVGNCKVASGDTTGPFSAQIVLSDSAVEKAVLEVARGGLLRRGLAYDWSDVGVITNIRPDHIGQDGIEDLEDLVWIKSLVAERVRENGTIVLNAEDEQSLKIRTSPRIQRLPRKFFLYAVDGTNADLREHLRAGGDGAWTEDGTIFMQVQKVAYRVGLVSDLRFTFGGKAQFQISNALAAVAASAAIGTPADQIMAGLMAFQPTTENRGRMNLYRVGEGYLILDYGHNPDAIAAMGNLLNQWKGYTKTAIFGLPGDRSNEIIEMSVDKLAQYFDQLVVRDDYDLRGRKLGEVPALVENWVKEKRPDLICRQAQNEKEAIETVLDVLGKNDIAVIFYDSFDAVMPLIRQYDPVPISMIPELDEAESRFLEEQKAEEAHFRSTHSHPGL